MKSNGEFVFSSFLFAKFFEYALSSESAYRIPFTAPVSPFSLRDMRDVLIRASWKILGKNPEPVQNMPGSNVRGRRKP